MPQHRRRDISSAPLRPLLLCDRHVMLARALLFRRGVPSVLEPNPLGRILTDDALDDSGHLHCKFIQVTVAVPRVRAAHALTDDNPMLAVWLAEHKGRQHR